MLIDAVHFKTWKGVMRIKGKLAKVLSRVPAALYRKNGGFGLNELLGTAAALIIAAFVVIPGLRTFAGTVISKLTTWWTTISASIFPTS